MSSNLTTRRKLIEETFLRVLKLQNREKHASKIIEQIFEEEYSFANRLFPIQILNRGVGPAKNRKLFDDMMKQVHTGRNDFLKEFPPFLNDLLISRDVTEGEGRYIEGEFTSPLAEYLPEECRQVPFRLTLPRKPRHVAPDLMTRPTTVVVLYPTLLERNALQRQLLGQNYLLQNHNLAYLILDPPFLGLRRSLAPPFNSLSDLYVAGRAVVHETHTLLRFLRRWGYGSTVFTGHSSGAALAQLVAATVRVSPSAPLGKGVGLALLCPPASIVDYFERIFSSSVDWSSFVNHCLGQGSAITKPGLASKEEYQDGVRLLRSLLTNMDLEPLIDRFDASCVWIGQTKMDYVVDGNRARRLWEKKMFDDGLIDHQYFFNQNNEGAPHQQYLDQQNQILPRFDSSHVVIRDSIPYILGPAVLKVVPRVEEEYERLAKNDRPMYNEKRNSILFVADEDKGDIY